MVVLHYRVLRGNAGGGLPRGQQVGADVLGQLCAHIPCDVRHLFVGNHARSAGHPGDQADCIGALVDGQFGLFTAGNAADFYEGQGFTPGCWPYPGPLRGA